MLFSTNIRWLKQFSSLRKAIWRPPRSCLRFSVSFPRSLTELFKLRIVALLLFAAVGGAFLGAGGWPGGGALALVTVTGGLASAGASALNQYLERDRDAQMRRTQRRPLVTGDIARPGWVPALALGMILVPSLAVSPANPALAFFVLLGALIYVGVYTVWLKPRTTLNIVIGGAAGSCAAISGGAAAGAWSDPAVLVLGLLIFLWTPAHFWTLAMMYRRDYARTGLPMLPARTTPRRSAFWVSAHAVATGCTAVALGVHPALGLEYVLPVIIATADLLRRSVRLLAEPTGDRARDVFMGSNIYLTLVLLIICLATLV